MFENDIQNEESLKRKINLQNKNDDKANENIQNSQDQSELIR
ncbi:unnamed protein product [Paramecium pentaurelia]|uniref:Uncharacterized protein n=1 Tax=Paramecium pentaurelia TaxID=43138 RepID=A0A8S1X0W9_9CILI|nr:unnamed protein product [Paramecium pentaurelia]